MKRKYASRWLCFLFLPTTLAALPQGGYVGSGKAEFSFEGKSLTVHAADKTVISYDSFNVEGEERVLFIQPSKESTVLNRVKGSNPSQILGKISSNGKVFLINPHGLYFGPDSLVDTGSLIVSTLDIADSDFREGKFSFRSGRKEGFIHNEGTLSSSGDIALISPHVKNEGVIAATLGKVLLASAEAVTLSFSEDGLMSFLIEEEAKDSLIEQTGSIEAALGEVFIRTASVKEAIANVINTDGLLTGDAFVRENGRVRIAHQSSIKARDVFIEGSKVSVEGEIDVSNKTSRQIGGTLHVLGDHIELRGAQIDASGDVGGGTVLIGGEYKGEGVLRTALTNFVDENSRIDANALSEGDGGRVIVWADDTALFNGTILVRGGEISGNGGFVETSGKENLGVTVGRVDARASYGRAGTWLLDPTTLTIDTTGTGTLPLTCGDTTTPTISTATIAAATANVILCASATITQNPGATIAVPSGFTLAFTGTGSTVTHLNGSITTVGQAVAFTSTKVVLDADVMIDTTNGGAVAGAGISFDSTGTINGAHALTLAGGTGTTTFSGSVGATTPLSSLTITSSTINVKAITTTGAMSFTGATTMSSTLTTSGNTIAVTGTLFVNNVVTFNTTGGGITAGGNVTLSQVPTGSNTSFVVNAGTSGVVTLNGGTQGGNQLGITITAGTINQNANVGSPNHQLAGALNYTASAININNGTSIVTALQPITLTGPVVVKGSVSFDTTDGGGHNQGANITLSGSITTVDSGASGSTLLLQAGTNGIIKIQGVVGGITPLANLIFSDSSLIQIGANITVTGANPFTTSSPSVIPVTLTAPSTITSNNGNITFNTINGGFGLNLVGGTGTTSFGTVGGTTPLSSLTAAAATVTQTSTVKTTGNVSYTGSTLINVEGNITTTSNGAITLTGPVALTNTPTVDTTNAGASTGANIDFTSTINGATSLTLRAGTGTTSFGTVGGTTALSSLSVTSATVIQNSTVKTTGDVSYTGSTLINVEGNITTTSNGAITLTGPVALTNTPTIDTTNAGASTGANIDFTSTIDGAASLTLRAGTGNITLSGSIGGITALTNLSFTTGALLQIGSNITVSGANPLSFPSAVPISLTGNSIITTNNANISFGGTINGTTAGAQALSIAAGTGTILLPENIGSTTALGNFSATTTNASATAITSGGNIITSGGSVSLSGIVSLSNTVTFDTTGSGGNTAGAGITFSSTLDTISAGSQGLTLNGGSTGTITFTGIVGGTTQLGALLISSTAGTSEVSIGSNITANSFTITNAVPTTLAGSSVINTSANNGAISFGGTIDGTTAGSQSLTLMSGTGAITLAGGIGSTTPLGNFSATTTNTGATALRIVGPIITRGGSISLTGIISLTGNATLDTTNGGSFSAGNTISFSSTINATAAGAQELTLNSGSTGAVTFTGAVGGTTRLGPLLISSTAGTSTVSIEGNVTANSFTITNNVPARFTLSGTTTINTSGNNGQIFFGGTLDGTVAGAQALTLTSGTGNTSLGGAVGASTALTSLSATTTGAGTITQNSSVRTTGNVTYDSATGVSLGGNISSTSNGAVSITGPVTLIGSVTIDTSSGGGGNVSFVGSSSTIDGAQILTVSSGSGSIAFGGAVGASTALTSVSATATGSGTITQSSSVRTSTGNVTYGSATPVLIEGNITTTSNGAVSITAPVALTGPITVDTSSGGGGNVSFVGSSSTIDGAQILTVSSGSGSIVFGGAVGASTALTSVSAAATGSGTITQSSSVRTSTGNVTYSSATGVALGGNISSTSNGAVSITGPVALIGSFTVDTSGGGGANVSFVGSSSTINGAESLAVTAGTGSVAFGGAIGASTALTSVSATATGAGTITQSSSVRTSTGNVTYSSPGVVSLGGNITATSNGAVSITGPVALIGSVTIDTSSGGGGNVSFVGSSSTIDGAESLAVTAGSGSIAFGGAVGASTALTSLAATTTGAGTITQTGSVRTSTGNVTYSSATGVALGGNISSTSNGAVSITGPVALIGPVTVDTSGGGGANVSFVGSSSTINGAESLAVTAGSGSIAFGGAVGASTALTSLSATATGAGTITQSSSVRTSTGNVTYISAGIISLGGNITTASNGAVSITGPVILTVPITVDTSSGGGANVSFVGSSSTIDGAHTLTLNSGSGSIAFGGAVGASTALTSLSATATGAGTITQSSSVRTSTGNVTYSSVTAVSIGGNITTTGNGAVSITGPVSLTGAATVDTSGGGGANVSFIGSSSTIDGAEPLAITSGMGSIAFGGAVGASTALTSLSAAATGAGTITQSSSVRTSTGNITYDSATGVSLGGNISATSNGAVSITGPVTLIGSVTIDTSSGGGANVSFVGSSSTIDGAQILAVNSGSGGITLGGATGGTTPLGSLALDGNTVTQSSSLGTTGSVVYVNTGLLTIGGTLTTGQVMQSGGGSVLLEADINSTNTVHFTDPVTFNTTVSLSAIGVSGLLFDNPLIPTVDSAYDLTLTVLGGDLTAPQLGSPSKYINTLTITAQAINVPPFLVFAHTVHTSTAFVINSNIVSPGGNLLFLAPITVAPGTFIVDVTGGTAPGSVEFESTLDGPGGVTFVVGDGPLTFDDLVGSITPFGAMTISSALDVTFTSNFTGDSLVQTAGTGTTTIEGTVMTTTSTGVSLTGNNFDITGAIVTTGEGPVIFDNSGLLNLANTVTSDGPVSFTRPVTLTGPVTVDTSSRSSTITFGNEASVDGAENVFFAAGSGTVFFGGPVGGTVPLTNLVFTSAGLIEIASDITVTGTNPLIFSAPVRMEDIGIITSNNADITFQSTLDGSVDPTINAGTGTVTFTGAVGSLVPLSDLTVIAEIILQNSSLTSSGPVTYINSGFAGIGGTISAESFTQSGGGSVFLGSGITAGSFIQLTDPVGFTTSLSITAGSGSITFTSPIIPTSTRIYNLTLSAKNGSIIGPQLGAPTEYINKLTLIARYIHVPLIYANILLEIFINPSLIFEYIPGIYTNYWQIKDTLGAPWYFDPGFITEDLIRIPEVTLTDRKDFITKGRI